VAERPVFTRHWACATQLSMSLMAPVRRSATTGNPRLESLPIPLPTSRSQLNSVRLGACGSAVCDGGARSGAASGAMWVSLRERRVRESGTAGVLRRKPNGPVTWPRPGKPQGVCGSLQEG
jgi:hypothetical protein